jgi:hypothetical protein
MKEDEEDEVGRWFQHEHEFDYVDVVIESDETHHTDEVRVDQF